MQTRTHRTLVVLAVTALVATGCGSDADSESTPVATTTPMPAPTTSAPPPETSTVPKTSTVSETSTDPADRTAPPVAETPTTEAVTATSFDPGRALQRLELPEELGAGYRRSPEPGTPFGPAAWAAIADIPECAPIQVIWDATMPYTGPLHWVLYTGATPANVRQVIVWGTDPAVATDLMSFLATNPAAAAMCWQEAIRGLGLTDLVITDLGLGEVPEAGADIVWLRHRWSTQGRQYDQPAALIRLGSLLALVAFDEGSTDEEVATILTDIESRLLAASQSAGT